MRMMLGGSRFASLGKTARAISAAAADEIEPGDEVIAPGDGGNDDETDETAPKPDNEPQADTPPAPDAASSERARVATVFASEHSQGRERQAADMLATSMSADEITGLLAKSPRGGASAGDKMLDRLATTPSPDLGAGANAETQTDARSSDAAWDRAWASTPRGTTR